MKTTHKINQCFERKTACATFFYVKVWHVTVLIDIVREFLARASNKAHYLCYYTFIFDNFELYFVSFLPERLLAQAYVKKCVY